MIGEHTIGYMLYCEAMHFVLGFAVGLLVWLLTSTIFSRFHTHILGRTARSIQNYSFLLALSLSVVAHILQDYWLSWF